MSRHSKSKTTRIRVAAPQLRDARIEEHTRFINARGDVNATGTADALRAAFGVGEQFLNKRTVRLNEEGEQQAITDSATGKDQDVENTNAGYNRGWSRLRAENDFINVEGEFKEFMRGADFENMDSDEVGQAYDTYMQNEFKGAELDPEYAAVIAPKLVALELETLADHRDMQLQNIQAEQGAMLMQNLQHIKETTGEFNYEYLAAETNRIWDGTAKNTKYAEILFDTAIEAGDPSMILDMPEKYPSGQPTIKDRPEYQDEIRTAVTAATTVMARKAAAEEAIVKEGYDRAALETQYAIVDVLKNNGDTTELVRQLYNNPESTFAQRTAAENFGNSQFDLGNKREAEPTVMLQMWDRIHRQTDGGADLMAEVMMLSNAGLLGGGEAGLDNFNKMMNAIGSYSTDTDKTLTNPDATQARAQINRQYNPTLAGPVPDGFISRINANAHARYNALLKEGRDPWEALTVVTSEFDTIVERSPIADIKALQSKTSLREFNRRFVVTAENVQRVIDDPSLRTEVLGGISQRELEIILVEKAKTGEITKEQINLLFE